jgi:type VI protein secretion system component VasF
VDAQHLESLTRVMQASISPVALISGVGLLILSQTNRLGRVMDRLRDVVEERRSNAAADGNLSRQVDVLHRRTRILRASVTAAVLCALLAAVLVLLLFSSAVLGARLDLIALAIFAGSLLSLIVSLALFIFDLNLSLRAVQDELLR